MTRAGQKWEIKESNQEFDQGKSTKHSHLLSSCAHRDRSLCQSETRSPLSLGREANSAQEKKIKKGVGARLCPYRPFADAIKTCSSSSSSSSSDLSDFSYFLSSIFHLNRESEFLGHIKPQNLAKSKRRIETAPGTRAGL